ncbi:MAG: hypothetical protein WC319_06525 [Candidatus Paceibacterota bacterium]|jgi:hypothetical protein
MFQGFIHIAERDFPRMYSFSWREGETDCFIVFGISRDATNIVTEKLKKHYHVLDYLNEEFGFKKFGSDFNVKRYGFEDCAIVDQLKDGSVELIFKLVAINNKKTEQYLFACAATIHVLVDFLMCVPEREIKDSLPQFITISTACYGNKLHGHGGNIHGELNKDVKRYLIYHYKNKGEILELVLKAMLKAAAKIGGKKEDELTMSLYSAKVRKENGFLSIDCPGNSCGLNTKDVDERYFLLRKIKEEDFGMDLICHNVDTIGQQIILIAALAALSDEVRKYYFQFGW